MSNNARDEQFKGFAKALLEDIVKATDDFCKDHQNQYVDEYEENMITLVARHAYGLAKHTMSHVTQGMAAENEGGPTCLEENMRCIPDMTELPKGQE